MVKSYIFKDRDGEQINDHKHEVLITLHTLEMRSGHYSKFTWLPYVSDPWHGLATSVH
jgi:hypothetical protein